MSNQPLQKRYGCRATERDSGNLGIERQPQEPSLGQQASRPTRCGSRREPAMGRVMVGMIAERECNQHIDVREGNQNPSSSSDRRMACGSIAGTSLETTTTGSPLRFETRNALPLNSACRSASPTYSSRVFPSAAAASRARRSNSRSIERVVIGHLSSGPHSKYSSLHTMRSP